MTRLSPHVTIDLTRHVRTPAGVAKYHEPIGSPIVAHPRIPSVKVGVSEDKPKLRGIAGMIQAMVEGGQTPQRAADVFRRNAQGDAVKLAAVDRGEKIYNARFPKLERVTAPHTDNNGISIVSSSIGPDKRLEDLHELPELDEDVALIPPQVFEGLQEKNMSTITDVWIDASAADRKRPSANAIRRGQAYPDDLLKSETGILPEDAWFYYQLDGPYQAMNAKLRGTKPTRSQYGGDDVADPMLALQAALMGSREPNWHAEKLNAKFVEFFDGNHATYKMPSDTAVYRGLSDNGFSWADKLQPGSDYVEKGIMSTSSTEEGTPEWIVGVGQGQKFHEPKGGAYLEIIVPKGKRFAVGNPEGNEIIFKPGEKLHILEVGKVTKIIADENGEMRYVTICKIRARMGDDK